MLINNYPLNGRCIYYFLKKKWKNIKNCDTMRLELWMWRMQCKLIMSMKKTLIITKQLIFNSFSCHLSIQIGLQKYKIKQCIHRIFFLSIEAITCLKGFKKTPFWHLVQRSERCSSKKKQIVGEQLTFALENPPLLLVAVWFMKCFSIVSHKLSNGLWKHKHFLKCESYAATK